MPSLFEGDGQFDLAATTNTDIFTGPDSFHSTLKIALCNRTGADITFRLALSKSGAALANSHYLYYDGTIPANDSVVSTDIPVNEKDVVRVYVSAVGVSANVLISDVRDIAVRV